MCIRDSSLALVDEADYVPDLATFLNAVKPTVDAGGKLFFCLLYTSDAADERSSVDLGGRRIIKKKKKHVVGESRKKETTRKRRSRSREEYR